MVEKRFRRDASDIPVDRSRSGRKDQARTVFFQNVFCPDCTSPKLDWVPPSPRLRRGGQAGNQPAFAKAAARQGRAIIAARISACIQFRRDKADSGIGERTRLACSQRRPRRWHWRDGDGHDYPSHPKCSTRGASNHTRGACAPQFPPSAIIKCPPLSATARRAGWVGCNFALNQIPVEARIAVVTEKAIVPATEVRERFKRVKPLKDISVTQRGWTLDVLNAVRRLGKKEFTTSDAYAFAREMEKLHPDNRHVKDKIRQQLQVLRDMGFLHHIERGIWRLPYDRKRTSAHFKANCKSHRRKQRSASQLGDAGQGLASPIPNHSEKRPIFQSKTEKTEIRTPATS